MRMEIFFLVCFFGVFFFFFFFFFVFFFFCYLIPRFFLLSLSLSLSLSFSLSLSPFSFTFSCAFCMLGHSSRAWLVLPGLHYEGTTVNRTFLVRKFDHFSLTLETPFGPFLDTLERSCSYYYFPKYYRIKWYYNWKMAYINLAVRAVQMILNSY